MESQVYIDLDGFESPFDTKGNVLSQPTNITTQLPLPEAQVTEPVQQTPGEQKAIDTIQALIDNHKPESDVVVEDDDTDADTTDDQGVPKTGSRKDALQAYLLDKYSKGEFTTAFNDMKENEDIESYVKRLPAKDLQELLDTNINKKAELNYEDVYKDVYESFHPKLKAAIDYVNLGGQDVEQVFSLLAQQEQVAALNPAEETDQKVIARNYLMATNFGNQQEVESQVTEWADDGKLEQKVAQFKPKLEQMYQQKIQAMNQQQAQYNEMQRQAAETYVQHVTEALKPGEIAGVKLDKKTINTLYQGLTQAAWPDVNNQPTTLLYHQLDKLQYSDKPDYNLLAEVLWHVTDPEGFRKAIGQSTANKAVEKVAMEIKNGQFNKGAASGIGADPEEKKIQRVPKVYNVLAQ